MRKLIVTEFITLDGVVEAPGGNETDHPHGGWQAMYGSDEAGRYKMDELSTVSSFLLGRKTYDQFASYWPTQTQGIFAERLNGLPKHILSSHLKDTTWNNCHILRSMEEVAELKRSEGGDILVYGSATLVKSLLHHDLIDELRLMVYPLSVGGGLRIFDDGREMKKFRLKNAKAFDNGVLILEYLPIGPGLPD